MVEEADESQKALFFCILATTSMEDICYTRTKEKKAVTD